MIPSDSKSSAAASILLNHIPTNEQSGFLRSFIASVQSSDHLSLELAASLTVASTDQSVTPNFVLLLERIIRDGEVQIAVSICLQHPQFGSEVLQIVAERVSKAKSLASDQQRGDDALQSYLLFAKAVVSRLPVSDAHSFLFTSCLNLLASQDRVAAEYSKSLVFALLAVNDETISGAVILPAQSAIWSCIGDLVALEADKTRVLLGYSLWLRWLVSTKPSHLKGHVTSKYWQLLIQGLRQNDTELRKICLNILRLTTATDSALVPNDVVDQYQRYCTVFETIILGRYINQIQECEKDLDLLAVSTSLHPQWLFVLLASAIDTHMQDSNRKFIGNWVMRSRLKQTIEFVEFFQNDFLPWAIQGSLFVSTLKWQDGQRRCVHADRLSQYIRRLLEDTTTRHQLTNGIAEMILRRKDYMFAYAIVYLLQGIRYALRESHKQKLGQLTNLPEVARDFVRVAAASCPEANTKQDLSSRSRGVQEQQAIERAETAPPDIQAIEALWDDLERLEYPKDLLMAMPSTILRTSVVDGALQDPILLAIVTEKLRVLLGIAKTKVFLFAPLMIALRNAIVAMPNAIGTLDIEDIIVSIAEHPPAPTIDLMLEEATVHLTQSRYEQYFGERMGYGLAAFIDIVSRLQGNQAILRGVLERSIQPWKDQKIPPPTVSSWKTTLQLQVLLLCCEQFAENTSEQNLALLDDLFHVLAIEPLPRYRYLLEWTIVRFLIRYNLEGVLLSRITSKDHHSNPKHLASLMKIGTILACRQTSEEEFAMRLMTAFVPLAASSKVVIRHEAQWQVPLLMDQARLRNWKIVTENPALTVLDDYIRSLERFHDPPLERQIGRFDPEKDHTLTNLVEGAWFGLDQIEGPLTSRANFVKLYNSDTILDKPASCMILGNELDHAAPLSDVTTEEKADEVALGPRTVNEASALQTKGAAYLARALSDPTLHQTRSNDIIVIASFVENPYNLGGLSRVSEIFGAASLCLQNQNVVSNKDFTRVSVSSHLHFPIVQLSAADVPQFLVERKSEGYSVVGIEQTDRSLVLGSENTILPKKVVLVVGSEREGIPAIVLTECDLLVEIPQQGITRSLNVQTAVSIVLYEHSRQHRKS